MKWLVKSAINLWVRFVVSWTLYLSITYSPLHLSKSRSKTSDLIEWLHFFSSVQFWSYIPCIQGETIVAGGCPQFCCAVNLVNLLSLPLG